MAGSLAAAAAAKAAGIVVVLIELGNGYVNHTSALASPGHYHPTIELVDDAAAAFEAVAFDICKNGETPGDVEIDKVDLSDPVTLGDSTGVLTYTIEISNTGSTGLYGVVITDTLPASVEFLNVTPGGSPPAPLSCAHLGQTPGGEVRCWLGDMGVGVSRHITLTVEVPTSAPCEIINSAEVAVKNATSDTDTETTKVRNGLHCPDTGDAPDSTNHDSATMDAYSGVQANFPTVFDDGTAPGPAHFQPSLIAYLGQVVSEEVDADVQPDEDAVQNIIPVSDAADLDGGDDGIDAEAITIPECGSTTVSFDITSTADETDLILNVWFDFNRDGDWEDTLGCMEGETGRTVFEWAVQDYELEADAGLHGYLSPTFYGMAPPSVEDPMWMRVTVSDVASPSEGDGRGPVDGYARGETEDYYLVGDPE